MEEVLAIHDLDEVFDGLHQRTRVKRGSLFSLDDANNHNLIFVGSPSENHKLSALLSVQEFVFQRLQDGPNPGEAKVFLASPAGSPFTEDYAPSEGKLHREMNFSGVLNGRSPGHGRQLLLQLSRPPHLGIL